MKLQPKDFEWIKHGTKRLEARILDEKRRALRVGDTITFCKLPDRIETLPVRVTELRPYPTFQALIADYPATLLGYPDGTDTPTILDAYHTIYTEEEEQKFGVLGILFDLV
jgi:ASC-1-like (ASCH) protein